MPSLALQEEGFTKGQPPLPLPYGMRLTKPLPHVTLGITQWVLTDSLQAVCTIQWADL